MKGVIKAKIYRFNPDNDKEFVRQLDDFNRLWYKYFHRVLIYQKDEPQYQEFSNQIAQSQSPFLRFLLEWGKPTPKGIQYSLENYRNNKNPLWLILALRQSNEDQKDFEYKSVYGNLINSC